MRKKLKAEQSLASPQVKQARSNNMRANRSKDTGPEIVVRRALHSLGYRYQLHRSDLPGKPDLVFPKYCTAVEVRGCFWHGHGCRLGQVPKARIDYWKPKIEMTQARDKQNRRAMRRLGWQLLEIWECELRANQASVIDKIQRLLTAGER